jgi:guanosine-3',5'-bis(diphosphate) 3'-pyrophosphohydrolase
LELGQKLLERSLNGIQSSWKDISQEQIQKVLEHNQCETVDALLRTIGAGYRMPYIVARQLVSDLNQAISEKEVIAIDSKVLVKGTEGMQISFANCCYPIPGDPIIGLPDVSSGLVVHSAACSKVLNFKDNMAQMHLSWVKDITDEFTVEIRVELERQRGIIAELAAAITRAEGNIERIGVIEQNAKLSVVSVVLHIQGRRHLANVMKRVRMIKAVVRLNRIVSKTRNNVDKKGIEKNE